MLVIPLASIVARAMSSPAAPAPSLLPLCPCRLSDRVRVSDRVGHAITMLFDVDNPFHLAPNLIQATGGFLAHRATRLGLHGRACMGGSGMEPNPQPAKRSGHPGARRAAAC